VAGFTPLRGLLLVVGAVMVLAGFVFISGGGLTAAWPGLWLVASGGVLMVVAVLERARYRSEAAERANEPAGPGGGETPGAVEPRFRPTDEVFVDPTSGRRMRVLLDPRTGERRYVAEA
jgi:hypothetical protein